MMGQGHIKSIETQGQTPGKTAIMVIKGSLRPLGLLFKNDRFVCTDSQKNIKQISSPQFTI